MINFVKPKEKTGKDYFHIKWCNKTKIRTSNKVVFKWFSFKVNGKELAACNCFVSVVKVFLGNNKDENDKTLID